MRYVFSLSILICVALILQPALIPAFLPPVLRPDVGILMAMAALAFGTRELGWSAVFLLGVHADLLGSGRFGLLTLCYLLSAGAVQGLASRELNRGDFFAPWVAGAAGTVLAHGLYCALGTLLGLAITAGRAFGETLSLGVAACVWGMPCVYLVGKLMYRLRVMSPEVQARWSNDERMEEAKARSVA